LNLHDLPLQKKNAEYTLNSNKLALA
jgi:hypothetical protein